MYFPDTRDSQIIFASSTEQHNSHYDKCTRILKSVSSLRALGHIIITGEHDLRLPIASVELLQVCP
jgi:hypothetical protein